jgi:hypothetical protein
MRTRRLHARLAYVMRVDDRAVYVMRVDNPAAYVMRADEHSEQARAPHTNEPRDESRYGALSLLQKPLHYRAGG